MCVALLSSFNLLKLKEEELQKRVLDKILISRGSTLSKLLYDSAVSLGGYNLTKSPRFSERLREIAKIIPTDLKEFSQSGAITSQQASLKEQIEKGAMAGQREVTEALAFIDSKQIDLKNERAGDQYEGIRACAFQIAESVKLFSSAELAESTVREIATLKLSTISSSFSAFLLGVVVVIMLSFHLAKLKSQRMLSGVTVITFLKGLAVVVVPLLILAIGLSILMEMIFTVDSRVEDQVHKIALINHANALSKLAYDAGVSMGGYCITKSPLFSNDFENTVVEIPREISELKTLVSADKKQLEKLAKIEQVFSEQMKIFKEARGYVDDNRVDLAQFRSKDIGARTRSLADQLQDALKDLTADAKKDEQSAQSLASEKVLPILYGLFAASVLLGLVLSFLFARGFSQNVVEK